MYGAGEISAANGVSAARRRPCVSQAKPEDSPYKRVKSSSSHNRVPWSATIIAMSSTVLIAIALVLLVAVVIRLVIPKGRSALFPYRKAALFSPAERSFFGVLEQAVGAHYCIFGKVRIADVVEMALGLSGSDRQSAFNRISAKHFDFLLCDKQDLSVVCAIELDDRSHSRSSRQQRDAFVTELCRNVDLHCSGCARAGVTPCRSLGKVFSA